MHVIEQHESNVRSYCRSFPAVFDRAEGSHIYDDKGREYVDFFSGAGALNYGHNHPSLKAKVLEYIDRNGITHSLDMATAAKERFLRRFSSVILEPRGLDYKIQFPGPTGTNSVEAALKLARKVTGRDHVISFTNAFHGMTLGALSVTGNAFKRRGAGIPLTLNYSMPYCGYFGDAVDTIDHMERLLGDKGSGIGQAAAVIVETVQAEGGLNTATAQWLRRLQQLCQRHGTLLIVDDIQVGCGRTGPFFSFEPSGIRPDIVCLSKSLSGYGLPMALTLMQPRWDQWAPGEHNGTFRGHNLAFVTATEALSFWTTDELTKEVQTKAAIVRGFLKEQIAKWPEVLVEQRGRGLLQGLLCRRPGLASEFSRAAFRRGLISETAGPEDDVLKLMPPLTIEKETLHRGLEILRESVEAVAKDMDTKSEEVTVFRRG
jgi:diaminobutyrate-2-oxoglutarate transaminase